MAVVAPDNVERFLAICAKWDVDADRDRRGHRHRAGWQIDWHGETLVDVPPRTVAHEGPVYERPYARPAWQDELQADGAETLPRARHAATSCATTLLRLVASPNLCDKSWVTDQYDRYVQGNTVLAQPEDAGMIRVDETTGLGVALSDRLQRAVRQARPVRRRAARAGRGLPQRRHHRRPAARGDRLPELRLARGPRRDVAVRRGHPRAGRRLPASSASRSPAATCQLLQPDRRRRRSCRRRSSACSA